MNSGILILFYGSGDSNLETKKPVGANLDCSSYRTFAVASSA